MGRDDQAAGQGRMIESVDMDAERSALGAMMLDAGRAWDVLDVAKPSDFHDPQHQIIAEAVHRLALRGEGTDPVLVEAEIAAAGDRFTRDIAYLYGLTTAGQVAGSAGFYAAIVAKAARRRALAVAAQKVAGIASDVTMSPDEQLEAARAAVDAAGAGVVQRVVWVGDEIDETYAMLAEKPTYVPTPWPSLNHLIGGLRPGGMYVVAARPAQGKSVIGQNLAVELADHGAVAFLSLEMSRAELHMRLTSQLGRVHMSSVSRQALDGQDWEGVRSARAKLQRMPLAISDEGGMTVTQIRAFVRSVAREQSLGGVVLDYLQLTESADSRKERHVHVAEVSRAMKLIAKEFNVPVIVLSQVNRKSEERADGRPRMSDLRESGAIEQDADVVMLLHRPEDRPGEADIIVAKNRGGNTGEVTLGWLGHFMTVQDAGGGFEP